MGSAKQQQLTREWPSKRSTLQLYLYSESTHNSLLYKLSSRLAGLSLAFAVFLLMSSFNHTLITGVPGIGKTTLIKQIADRIVRDCAQSIRVYGFYTEEVRNGGERIGFDVIDINNRTNRVVLSRANNSDKSGPKVGKYSVDVKSFESIALPVIERAIASLVGQSSGKAVVIIDEIGKMEMFSERFKRAVRLLFDSESAGHSMRIVATIPVKKNIEFVEELRKRGDCSEVRVERANREAMVDDIVRMLCENAFK